MLIADSQVQRIWNQVRANRELLRTSTYVLVKNIEHVSGEVVDHAAITYADYSWLQEPYAQYCGGARARTWLMASMLRGQDAGRAG